MHVLRHAHEVSAFSQAQPDSAISTLLHRRLEDLLTDGDAMEDLVFFAIPEAGDTLADLEAALGSPVHTADGHPLWDVIEAHADCYEMVFVLASSGYGALVLVPHMAAGPELLAMCRAYAVVEADT